MKNRHYWRTSISKFWEVSKNQILAVESSRDFNWFTMDLKNYIGTPETFLKCIPVKHCWDEIKSVLSKKIVKSFNQIWFKYYRKQMNLKKWKQSEIEQMLRHRIRSYDKTYQMKKTHLESESNLLIQVNLKICSDINTQNNKHASFTNSIYLFNVWTM